MCESHYSVNGEGSDLLRYFTEIDIQILLIRLIEGIEYHGLTAKDIIYHTGVTILNTLTYDADGAVIIRNLHDNAMKGKEISQR
jgi:hypothetical protein